MLIERFVNVATPFVAVIVFVPESVPLAGLVSIATVIAPVNVVTRVPLASSAETCTAGVIG